MRQQSRPRATLRDLLALDPAERFHEIIAGELTRKADPSYEHGDAQSDVASAIKAPFQRRRGPSGAAGWWIATEVEVELSERDIYRPDVVGWRRDRVTMRPTGTPVRLRPDWVCEIVSPTRPREDTVRKLRGYHQAEAPHYWLLDLRDGTLTVLRHSSEGYVVVLRAESTEIVRAEPFHAIEIRVGALFGADDPEES
jgi:Uma2 family endonuclease